MWKAPGACLHKFQVQQELSAQIILNGFEMLFRESGKQEGKGQPAALSHKRPGEQQLPPGPDSPRLQHMDAVSLTVGAEGRTRGSGENRCLGSRPAPLQTPGEGLLGEGSETSLRAVEWNRPSVLLVTWTGTESCRVSSVEMANVLAPMPTPNAQPRIPGAQCKPLNPSRPWPLQSTWDRKAGSILPAQWPQCRGGRKVQLDPPGLSPGNLVSPLYSISSTPFFFSG